MFQIPHIIPCLKLAQYSITDLERFTGVKAHTIRIWEKRYCICKPSRDANNIRQYDEDDLQHLIKVSHLKEQGHKISAIACLSTAELDQLYSLSVNSNSGCCIQDKLTIAVQKTQESKLYSLLKQQLDVLGIKAFVHSIWEPMQERLGFLVLSGALHKVHIRLFDQIVERILESENIDLMLGHAICKGSALMINTCGRSSSVFHHLTKRLLIEKHIDVLSLSLCQSDWDSLSIILQNRMFHHIFIHYKSAEYASPPPCDMLDEWLTDQTKVILYGSKDAQFQLPVGWMNLEVDEVLTYVTSIDTYKQEVELSTS